MSQEFVVKEPADFSVVIEAVLAKAVTEKSAGAVVLALKGDLGAGKTTFTQILGRTLGVTEQITSPTFTIMKTYAVAHEQFDTLVHIDAYRIESETEIAPLKITEILTTPRTLVCIEWPEQIPSIIPTNAIHVDISIKDDESRLVNLH